MRNLIKKAIPKKIIEFIKKNKKENHDDFILYVKKKKDGFEYQSSEIVNLALRGSNADYAFHATKENNSYNLGLTSSDLYMAYKLYAINMEKLTKLENIIVFFNVASPGLDISMTSENFRSVVYKFFFNVDYQSMDRINKKTEKEILKSCVNVNYEKHGLISEYFGSDEKKYYGSHITAEERAKTHLRENKRENRQTIWLEKLVQLAKLNNIDVYCVLQPVRSDFKELLPSDSELFRDVLDMEFDNFKVLNYFNSNEMDDTHLGDTDHLNEKGSMKITEMILRDIDIKNEY